MWKTCKEWNNFYYYDDDENKKITFLKNEIATELPYAMASDKNFSKGFSPPIDGTLTGITILGQSGSGNNENKRVWLCTFQNLRTGTSPLDKV